MRPKRTVDLMKAKNSPKGGMFPFFNPKAPDWCPMSMLGETKVLNQMKNFFCMDSCSFLNCGDIRLSQGNRTEGSQSLVENSPHGGIFGDHAS